MELFNVDMITDLDEQVSICVHANDQSEAEAIAVSMLENGQLDLDKWQAEEKNYSNQSTFIFKISSRSVFFCFI